MPKTDASKELLALAPLNVLADCVTAEDGSQDLRAGPRRRAVETPLDPAKIEVPERLRLIECLLDQPPRASRGEVEDGPRPRRARDAIVDDPLVVVERWAGVGDDAIATPAASARHQHVGGDARPSRKTELVRSGNVGQQGGRAACERSGNPPSATSQARVADRINPAMDRVETSGRHSTSDCGGAQAERRELPERNDSELTLGKRCDRVVDGHFRRPSRRKCPHAEHSPTMSSFSARVVRAPCRI